MTVVAGSSPKRVLIMTLGILFLIVAIFLSWFAVYYYFHDTQLSLEAAVSSMLPVFFVLTVLFSIFYTAFSFIRMALKKHHPEGNNKYAHSQASQTTINYYDSQRETIKQTQNKTLNTTTDTSFPPIEPVQTSTNDKIHPKSPHNKIGLLLLGILCVFLVGGILYTQSAQWLAGDKANQVELNYQDTVSTPTMSPEINNETEWESYTAPEFQVAFKYPPTWKIVNANETKPEYNDSLLVKDLPTSSVNITYCKPELDCYPLARLKLSFVDNKPDINDLTRINKKFAEGSTTNLDFVSVYNSQEAPYPMQTYFTLPSQQVVLVDAWLPSHTNCQGDCPRYEDTNEIIELGQEINQILSTFEALEQTNISKKIHVGTVIPVKFEYPSELYVSESSQVNQRGISIAYDYPDNPPRFMSIRDQLPSYFEELNGLNVGETYQDSVVTEETLVAQRLSDQLLGGKNTKVFEWNKLWEIPGPVREYYIPYKEDYLMIRVTYSNTEVTDPTTITPAEAAPMHTFDYITAFDHILATLEFID